MSASWLCRYRDRNGVTHDYLVREGVTPPVPPSYELVGVVQNITAERLAALPPGNGLLVDRVAAHLAPAMIAAE
jgi:hypothetical protein